MTSDKAAEPTRLREALERIVAANEERKRIPHGNRGIVRRHRVYDAVEQARALLQEADTAPWNPAEPEKNR